MGSPNALLLAIFMARFASEATCTAAESTHDAVAHHGPAASPIAPHYAVAFAWLDGLHRGDESVLRRRSALPRSAASAFHAAGFADHNGPCPRQAATPAEFTQQLRCVMRSRDADGVAATWTLRDLDSPARDPEAWGLDSDTAPDSLGSRTGAAHVVEWTGRDPGAGGCSYRVAVDDESRVIAAERACWLE